MVQQIKSELKEKGDAKQAKLLARFFKTGKGEYGEGDIFLGIKVPIQRQIAKKYKNSSFKNVEKLLKSKIHEERLVALLILVDLFEGDEEKVYKIYLDNTKYVNNWDLVDLTAHKIVGRYLKYKKDRQILKKLAKSKNLWERRISIISTFAFINDCDFKDALQLAEILLADKHDLIHKAVGWVLREIGKKDLEAEEMFLKKHYQKMPRTMLRYAIEKFPEKNRKMYLRMV